MSQVQTIIGDTYTSGNVSCGSFTPPAGCISDASVVANAQIAATKLQMQGVGLGGGLELFGPTTSVAALTKTLFMANAAGTLTQFGAWIEVVASGSDRTITVDLQKSTGAGSYATVLSATVGFTNGSSVRTLVTGTLSAAAFVAGDIFRAVVTVSGSSPSQATGLSIKLVANHNSQ